jgi:hypothetical protein
MPHLLGPLPCHQVKLPGHHQKVVMVKAVICISTGSGAEDPPGGQDSSSTVMTTKACYLQIYFSSSQARVTLLYLKRDCVWKLARRSLLKAKCWQDKSSLDDAEERKHVEVLPVGEELGRNIGDKEYVLINTNMQYKTTTMLIEEVRVFYKLIVM